MKSKASSARKTAPGTDLEMPGAGVKLGSLAVNELNPRTITSEAREALRRSLEEFGDLSGFVFNRQTGRLVGGHQRQSVLPTDAAVVVTDRLDDPTPQGTVARGYVAVGEDRIPYREVSWDATREKAAMLAANKHGGEFDDDAVAKILRELHSEGFDTALTGFLEDLGEDGKSKAAQAQYPITAKLHESYDYVLIFCENASDFVFLQTLVGAQPERSYKKTGIGLGRCVPFRRFLDAIRENHHSLDVPRADNDHAPAGA